MGLKRLWYWHAARRTWRRTGWTSDTEAPPADAEQHEHEQPHWIPDGVTPEDLGEPGPSLEEYCRG